MSLFDFLGSKSKRKHTVRQMGNFGTHVTIYIYVIMALIIIACVVMSLMSIYKSR